MASRWIFFFFSPTVLLQLSPTTAAPLAPAMFVLGDSLVDNGNNNFIPSIARANYLPYGIDFGGGAHPTGRFCNGLTVVDYGASLLGLPFPPPYLSIEPHGREILQGVNYASAAAGILDETGKHYGARVTFNGQIALLERTVRTELPLLVGAEPEAMSGYLAKAIFVVNIGSNDYINNYLLPNIYATSRQYSGEAFADLLIGAFTRQLNKLYELGARKMVLVGIGPLGCIPSQLATVDGGDGRCVERVNALVTAFNRRLAPLAGALAASLPGAVFVYQNIYDTFRDMVNDPSKYGFRVATSACCGSGRYGGAMSCLPLQPPCSAREEYIFWDSFHPTQAANAVVAEGCYTPAGTDCHPINVIQLAQI